MYSSIYNVSVCYFSVVHFSAGQPYCCVKFVSLRAGEEVHNVSFGYPVSDIKANDRYVLVKKHVALIYTCRVTFDFIITQEDSTKPVPN